MDHLILSYIASPAFFSGAVTTLKVSVCALAGGLLIGSILALLQESHLVGMRAFVLFYLWLFRGTPVLFQVLFIYNVLPSFGVTMPAFACAVLGLALNEGASMCAILRSGLQSIANGQKVAARSLGMTKADTLKLIVFPQGLRIVLPPIGNQFISMLRLSALVSVIAVQELTLVANQTAASSFNYLEALSAAGIYYLTITSVFMILQYLCELWADPKSRRGRVRAAVARATVDRS